MRFDAFHGKSRAPIEETIALAWVHILNRGLQVSVVATVRVGSPIAGVSLDPRLVTSLPTIAILNGGRNCRRQAGT